MFIKIGKSRIKLSSIGEFKECGKAGSNQKWYIEIKVSGRNRLIYFEQESEYMRVVEYLDKALKIIEV